MCGSFSRVFGGLCFGLWEQVVGCFVWPLVVGVVWAGCVVHLALCFFCLFFVFCFVFLATHI